jgi:hypothetical protein
MLSEILDQEQKLISQMKVLDRNIEQRIQGNIPGFEKLRNRLRSMWEDKESHGVDIGQVKRLDNKFKDVGFKVKGMFDVDKMKNWKSKNNQIPWEEIKDHSPHFSADNQVDPDHQIVQNYFLKKKSTTLGRSKIFLFEINR